MTGAFAARAVWTPTGWRREHTVVVRGRTVVDVRPWRPSDPGLWEGAITPGLVNAHTHLELSASGEGATVPGGQGFSAWAGALMAGPSQRGGAVEAARAVVASGVAWAMDVGNTPAGAAAMRQVGLQGVAQREVLGFDLPTVDGLRRQVRQLAQPVCRGVWVRPCPHAVFSTAPALVADAVRFGRTVPASIHLGEAEGEADFVAHGSGPLADLLDRLGRRWRAWSPRGQTPVAHLDALGLLGPGLVLVHGVRLGPADRRRCAVTDTPLVLCPRSNLHIGGQLPDVPAWSAAGVRLALGTDSLASSPSLDVVEEAVVLARAFPTLSPDRWWTALTHGGASVTGAPASLGRIEPGARPGLVLFEGLTQPEALVDGAPSRTWLLPPGEPS